MPAALPEAIRAVSDLAEAGLIHPGEVGALERVAARYPAAVPPALRALIEWRDDPIGRQFIPHPSELVTAPDEMADPIADEALSPIKGIVHRYPDRVLLKPLLACPVYCRFCFRREQVGPDGGVLSEAELAAALGWIAARPAIREVILTGGDPLMLSARRLRAIVEGIEAIPHVEIIRVHTRLPVADPARLTDAAADALASERAVFVAVHVNAARELTPEAMAACRRLLARGIPLLGQSVLLRGVNDSEAALEELFRAMLRARIKPYYLHHLDPAPGTARFRVPVEEGLALLRGLRGRVTGLAWPTYVFDQPGGAGKATLGPVTAPDWNGGRPSARNDGSASNTVGFNSHRS